MNKHKCTRFLLCMLIGSLSWPVVYAQQESKVSMRRYVREAEKQTAPKANEVSEKEKLAKLSSVSVDDNCSNCSQQWDLLNKSDVLALKSEIETHALDSDYEWKAKLKFLYTSPHVMKTYIMDPTFPIIILSGDETADIKAYNQAKTDWVANYPARYQALKRSHKPSK